MMRDENPLIGKVVTALFLAEDKKALRFDLEEGESLVVRVDADCCSYTWIEEIQGVEQLIGSRVVSVEDVNLPDKPNQKVDDGLIQFYGCKITTEKGYCLIDYRNESNGYYGGDLSWPGDYFYGGVFDQNVSKQEWKQVG